MGGNQYHLPRLPRAAYLKLEQQVRQVLDDLIPGGYRIPLAHLDKTDFGDMDLLVDSAHMTPGLFSAFAQRVGAVEQRSVGHIQSFHVPGPGGAQEPGGMQVDLFATPAELLDVRCSFMDYGDLGNILGRLVRPYGLMWGDRGLELIYRRADDEHYRHHLPVPGGIDTVLDLIGLAPEPLRAGFGNEAEMHRWLITARDFRSWAFLDPDGRIHLRSKNRPGIARFNTFLEAEIQAGRLQAAPRMERQDVSVLLSRLEGGTAEQLGALWNEQVRLEERAARLAERFTGDRLLALRPDLGRMEFEMLVRALKNLPADAEPGGAEWMLARSPEDVHAWLLTLPAPVISAHMRATWEKKIRINAQKAEKKAAAKLREGRYGQP
ncbi:hypothetical protein [Deinococcus altitudinis]|uniref:hypothetical protein n=1 Tax=Deinococcus altitudinis TaxID=468914 RepID=UPI0038917DE5